MSNPLGPVTVDDVKALVGGAVDTLTTRLDRDWHVPTGALEWDCWGTIEHIGDALFFYATQLAPSRETTWEGYPFGYRQWRPTGPESTISANSKTGTRGLVLVLDACGGLLVSLLRTAPPGKRAHHVWGRSDPEGFAAMGIVEIAVHMHDVSAALELDWAPDAELCDRVLNRLFPDAPTDTERWPTLLWATGRIELPGRPQLAEWRWYAEPHR